MFHQRATVFNQKGIEMTEDRRERIQSYAAPLRVQRDYGPVFISLIVALIVGGCVWLAVREQNRISDIQRLTDAVESRFDAMDDRHDLLEAERARLDKLEPLVDKHENSLVQIVNWIRAQQPANAAPPTPKITAPPPAATTETPAQPSGAQPSGAATE